MNQKLKTWCYGGESEVFFPDYLRHNLEPLNKNKPVPFSDELQHTEVYLCIENVRDCLGSMYQTTLTIESVVGKGTTAMIKTPKGESQS